MKSLDLMMRDRTVRQRTLSVCAPLSIEDHAIQSMPEPSSAKWHLAHTRRNFFAPAARWQMTGVRLANDRRYP